MCVGSTILDSPVTEQEFLEQLHELNTKINFAKELSFRETLACSDIQDIVDRLKLKVRDGREESSRLFRITFTVKVHNKQEMSGSPH